MATRSAAPIETPPPDTAEGWVRPLMARQIEALGQMAEAGLDMVLDLRRQALEGADDGAAAVGAEALALAFSRLSRAVRMTFALQHKAVEDLRRLDHFAAGRGPVPAPASPDDALGDAPFTYADMTAEDRRLNRAQRIVERVIEAEHGQDTEASERLVGLSFERLEREDLYDAVLSRPLSAVVAEICEELGLEPDWSLVAGEPWARAELDGGAATTPLARWRAGRDPPRSSSSEKARPLPEDPAGPPCRRGAPLHPRDVDVIAAGFPRQARE